jgi:TolA-binding protein
LAGAERVAWHRRSIDSALRFAAAYPEHPEAAAVETNGAERLFALGEFAAARDVAMRVVLRNPPAPAELERTAWVVAAHSEFDLASYTAAETAYLAALDLVPADDPQRAPLIERLASSIYKQGEEARNVGDDHAAVAHFLRVGAAAPTSEIRATAEYDAAAALMRLGDWSRAATVLEDFRRRYPDDALVADATANLAVAYLEAGDAARAAAEFERIADGDADVEVRREASWRAAELWAESGDTARAANAFTRYVERHPVPAPAAIDARQRLAELARMRNDSGEEMRWLAAMVAADAAAGAERTARTQSLAAHAQLRLAEPQRDAFLGVRLVAPLDRSLARKRELMEAALASYRRAVDYGLADVTTAATYEIAELYHALGRDLIASERPAELQADELSQYEILLEEQAFPFEEQAIEVHEVNVARIADGVYDEWVRASLEALAELMPVRYAKQEINEQLVSAVR